MFEESIKSFVPLGSVISAESVDLKEVSAEFLEVFLVGLSDSLVVGWEFINFRPVGSCWKRVYNFGDFTGMGNQISIGGQVIVGNIPEFGEFLFDVRMGSQESWEQFNSWTGGRNCNKNSILERSEDLWRTFKTYQRPTKWQELQTSTFFF